MVIKQFQSKSNVNLAPINGWSIPLVNAENPIIKELYYFQEGDDHVEILCENMFDGKEFIYTTLISYEEVFRLLKYVLKVIENRDDYWIADLIAANKSELRGIKSILNCSESINKYVQ